MPANQLPPIGRSSLAGAPWTGRSVQIRSSTRWQTIAITNKAALTNRMPFSPMLLHREVGDQRARERAGAAARRDDAEQALRLAAVEDLEQKAPEHRDQEQIHDTDEDVEGLG